MGQIAQLHVVHCAFDSTTFGVSQNDDDFNTDDFASKFHWTENVLIQNIASNTDAENIAQSLVKNQFGRSTAVNTTQNDGKRVLSFFGFVDLLQQIAVCPKVIDEAVVAVFQNL